MKTLTSTPPPLAPAGRGLSRRAATGACLALAAVLAHAAPPVAEEHVGIYAEKGDPARWRIPANTPQLRYEAEAKGSRAALAEALKECPAMPAERSACASQAQAQYRQDIALARSVLERERVSGLAQAAPR